MNKTAFLKELRKRLKQLSKAERQQYIDYYAEMIDDRMEEGISEEEAVAVLGSADEIAAQIPADAFVKPARKGDRADRFRFPHLAEPGDRIGGSCAKSGPRHCLGVCRLLVRHCRPIRR